MKWEERGEREEVERWREERGRRWRDGGKREGGGGEVEGRERERETEGGIEGWEGDHVREGERERRKRRIHLNRE